MYKAREVFELLEIKGWIIAGAVGILLFMAIGRSVTKPLRWIWYGLLYTAVGGLVLFIVNLMGRYVDVYVPINPVTALVAGGLGVPGVICLVCVKVFLIG